MAISPNERREVLGLFNVSEAAREVGVDVQRLFRDIRAGRVPAPSMSLGKRMYFTNMALVATAKFYDVSV